MTPVLVFTITGMIYANREKFTSDAFYVSLYWLNTEVKVYVFGCDCENSQLSYVDFNRVSLSTIIHVSCIITCIWSVSNYSTVTPHKESRLCPRLKWMRVLLCNCYYFCYWCFRHKILKIWSTSVNLNFIDFSGELNDHVPIVFRGQR